MAQLAIKGHTTRGKEVIELLEMLGGKNVHNYNGVVDLYYTINKSSEIIKVFYERHSDLEYFTLESFLKEFPYKVGDKVLYHQTYAVVNAIKWDGREIVYTVECNKELWETTACFLEPYKEEPMEEKLMPKIDFSKYSKDKYLLDMGDYEIKEEEGKTYVVRKKPQYPKTYEECCEILGVGVLNLDILDNMLDTNEIRYSKNLDRLLNSFRKLLICRDSYWKIVGDWKPDWKNFDVMKHCIRTDRNVVGKCNRVTGNGILAFPTAEMRDDFCENFKALIEECKELL